MCHRGRGQSDLIFKLISKLSPLEEFAALREVIDVIGLFISGRLVWKMQLAVCF